MQGGQGAGVFIFISPRNIQFGDCGYLFHVSRRDIFRIGDMPQFLQLLRKARVEQDGEIRFAGCSRLGDGQPHGLFSACKIDVGRAGGGLRILGGRQFDRLFAGRAARGRDGQPVGSVLIGDGERPVGRGGEGCRGGPIFGGAERVFGLSDGQFPGPGSAFIVLLAAGKGKGGSKCQQVK